MTIEKDDFWFYSKNPKNNDLNKITAGKWMTSLDKKYAYQLFRKIDRLVETGRIHSAKYSRRKSRKDPFFHNPIILCVYADGDTKRQTLKELKSLGILKWSWKYDLRTFIDWLPGGKLHKKAVRYASKEAREA